MKMNKFMMVSMLTVLACGNVMAGNMLPTSEEKCVTYELDLENLSLRKGLTGEFNCSVLVHNDATAKTGFMLDFGGNQQYGTVCDPIQCLSLISVEEIANKR